VSAVTVKIYFAILRTRRSAIWNSLIMILVSAFGVLAAGAPSSAVEFLLKAHSGRCMHAFVPTEPGDETVFMATDTCGNGPGFIAVNLTGGFSGTEIGFRKAPDPAESFVCLHAQLPPPTEVIVQFPVVVLTNNCSVPPPVTHWGIGTAIFVSDVLAGEVSVCLEETSEHKVVGNRCNGIDAQKWEVVPQR
jgi:hypothetical protein